MGNCKVIELFFSLPVLKLRGGATHPKFLNTENDHLKNLITVLRSLDILILQHNHNKCKLSQQKTINDLCQFCLIRSLVIRSNSLKGRTKLNPVELSGSNFEDLDDTLPFKTIIKHVFISLFEDSATSFLEEYFWTIWDCLACFQDNATAYIDFTHAQFKDKDVSDLLDIWEKDFNDNHGQHFDVSKANEKANVFFVASDVGVKVVPTKILVLGGRKWRCKSIIGSSQSLFYCNKTYYIVGKDENTIFADKSVNNAIFIAFEIFQENTIVLDDNLAYIGNENKKILSTFDKRKEDRHTSNKDRHTSNKDRHIPTPKRNEDRHTRTSERKEYDRRHHRNSYNQNKIKKLIEELNTETGMDLICCVCMELKAKSSCSVSSTVSKDKLDKYVLDWEKTRNIDGKHYICNTCKICLKNNKEPARAQRELLGLLGFPKNFKEEITNICKPANPKKDTKDFTELNKLEDFLLKPVIPFIRLAHMPRGPHLKVKGDLIMISSNLAHSLNSILPQSQDLIPVSFKRKLEYKGYYIEEYVDRQKLHAYFNFFKKYNHLFKDFNLDDNTLDEFEKELLNKINQEEDEEDSDMETDDDNQTSKLKAKDDTNDSSSSSDSDSNNDEPIIYPGKALFATNSLIIDKYKEDSSNPTVANKLADMVVQLENLSEDFSDEPYVDVNDPEEEIFPEDNESITSSDDEEEDNDLQFENLTDDDFSILEKCKNHKKDIMKFEAVDLTSHCNCSLTNICGLLMQTFNEIMNLKAESDELKTYISETQNLAQEIITKAKDECLKKPICNHDYNELMNFYKTIVIDSKNKPEDIKAYLKEQNKQIQKNLHKISVAPGEEGKWQNWGEDIFLEEKLFPKLFPWGQGGFLSSNILKNSNMGFSNYVKSRLLSLDPKFRNDPYYIFFLLLVKEMVDTKRSEKTFFRKATKVPHLNASLIGEITPEFLMRNNNAFTAYKTIRGKHIFLID